LCGNSGCDCGTGGIGNPVVIWPGWITNDARNNGADIYPGPIVPLHYGNWAAMSMQLKNGLETSTFGNKDSYGNYLKQLYSSASMNSKGVRQIEPTFHPAGTPQPSTIQLAQMVTNGAPGQTNLGGTGDIAAGVDLNARAYYG
jgi:hypothetical protein